MVIVRSQTSHPVTSCSEMALCFFACFLDSLVFLRWYSTALSFDNVVLSNQYLNSAVPWGSSDGTLALGQLFEMPEFVMYRHLIPYL